GWDAHASSSPPARGWATRTTCTTDATLAGAVELGPRPAPGRDRLVHLGGGAAVGAIAARGGAGPRARGGGGLVVESRRRGRSGTGRALELGAPAGHRAVARVRDPRHVPDPGGRASAPARRARRAVPVRARHDAGIARHVPSDRVRRGGVGRARAARGAAPGARVLRPARSVPGRSHL